MDALRRFIQIIVEEEILSDDDDDDNDDDHSVDEFSGVAALGGAPMVPLGAKLKRGYELSPRRRKRS